MEALLFLGDRPVERIAADAIPQIARVLRLAGHRVRWQPDVGCLFVDSPLEGRIIGCRAHGDARGVAAQSLDELFRWVRMAGGVPAAPGLVADAVIRLVAEPCAAHDLPSILVSGGRRRWFLPRRSDLVVAVADCLRDLVDVPVGVISRPTDGAEVEVRIKVPPEIRVSHAVARAIWLALMATCGRSRGEREPSHAWIVQALEWWESRPAAEVVEPLSPARPAAQPRAGRPGLRAPVDPVAGRRPRIVWESEGRDPSPRTPVLPEPGTAAEGAPSVPFAVFAPAAGPEEAAAAQAPGMDQGGFNAPGDAIGAQPRAAGAPVAPAPAPADAGPNPQGAAGTAADAPAAAGPSADAPTGPPAAVAGSTDAAPRPAAAPVTAAEAAPTPAAVPVAAADPAPKLAALPAAPAEAPSKPAGAGAPAEPPQKAHPATGPAPSGAAAEAAPGSTAPSGAPGAETAAEPAPAESTRRRVAAASNTFRFPIFERRSSAPRR